MGQAILRGRRRLIDSETGEVIETHVIEKAIAGGDVGFHKVWLGHILEAIEEIGNAKMQVLMWLLRHADAQNQILARISDIAAGAGVSVGTVETLMKSLRRANIITRKDRYGLWRLNPEVIFKGDHQARMNVLYRYRDEKQGDLFDESKDKAAPLRLVA